MKLTNMPVMLVMIGLALTIIEEMTYKPEAGGLLFGSAGYLKGINAMLPVWTIPGTKTLSVRYPSGFPVRLDAWIAIAGLAMMGWERIK